MQNAHNTLGLIGLGLVGTALVERFFQAGFDIAGYDSDPSQITQQGNRIDPCHSPAEVATKARRIVLSLPNSHIVNSVVEGKDGLIETAQPGALIIDTTTADPVMSTDLAQRLNQKNIHFLDFGDQDNSAIIQVLRKMSGIS